MKLEDIIRKIMQNEIEIRNFGVRRLGIFGSFVKGTNTESSDVDILVSFEDVPKIAKAYFGLKYYLEDLLNMEVDLCRDKDIRIELKDEIMKSVKYILDEKNRRSELFKQAKCKDFKEYREKTKNKLSRIVIVIDEFQEFYNIRPDVFSDMQNLWDEYRQETKINLVISGSVYSLMQKIFTDHGEPLFGRADNILCLRSFNTKVLKQIMEDFAPGYSNDDLLALYTLTGGIPKYVELFCDNQALTIDKMYDFVFSENSLFIDEGRNLLITEFGKNYGTYFSILSEIANGHYTQGEIESALGGTAIGGYLSKLENVYNLITRERPIFAKPGTKKNVRYVIGDNFLNFWFKYIEQNRSYIELQNFDDLRQLAKADYPTYSGRVLEKYFKQKLAETGGFKEIGSWWETKSSIGKQRINSYEIDIVALKSSGKKALIAEVKRVPENNYSHTVFMEKVEHLKQKEMSKYDIETQVLGLKDM